VNLVVVVVVLVEHDVVFVVVVLVTILELWVHLPIPQVIVSVSALSSGTSELCSSVF
jgi:hypothetical protein